MHIDGTASGLYKWPEAQYCVHICVHLNTATWIDFAIRWTPCNSEQMPLLGRNVRALEIASSQISCLFGSDSRLPCSRLLGYMQDTVETHTLNIEATTASRRDKVFFRMYLIFAAGTVEALRAQRRPRSAG